MNSKGEAYQTLQPFMHIDAELEETWLCVWEEKQKSHIKKKTIPVPIIAEKKYFWIASETQWHQHISLTEP